MRSERNIKLSFERFTDWVFFFWGGVFVKLRVLFYNRSLYPSQAKFLKAGQCSYLHSNVFLSVAGHPPHLLQSTCQRNNTINFLHCYLKWKYLLHLYFYKNLKKQKLLILCFFPKSIFKFLSQWNSNINLISDIFFFFSTLQL